jgi:hypothetical protein
MPRECAADFERSTPPEKTLKMLRTARRDERK